MFDLNFIGNAVLFGAVLLGQFGLFDALFRDDSDDTTPAADAGNPGPDDVPGFDPNAYGMTLVDSPGAHNVAVPAGTASVAVFLKDGDDVVETTAGNDFVHGGDGNDRILTGDGADVIHGGAGNDVIQAGDGNDIVHGGAGNDTLLGELGEDEMHGGDGNDILHGSRDNDTLFGDAGDDRIEGGGLDDQLHGGDGDDVISADLIDDWSKMSRGNDTLDGGAGNDRLILAAGDQATGGAGNDLFQVVEIAGRTDAAKIHDFNPAEDRLEIHVQNRTDAGGNAILPQPVRSYDANDDLTKISLDGTVVVTLKGDITFTDANLKIIRADKPVG